MATMERFSEDDRADEDAYLSGAWEMELEVEDAFGAHDIEYWVRRGNRLVPATEEDIARIRAWEDQRVARSLVGRWKRDERRLSRRWLAWCRGWFRRDARRSGEEGRGLEVAEERPELRQG